LDNIMRFVILVAALISAFYFFVAGLPLWLVAVIVLPGVLLIAAVIGGAKE